MVLRRAPVDLLGPPCEPLLTGHRLEARQQNVVDATLVTGSTARTDASESYDRALELVAESLLSE